MTWSPLSKCLGFSRFKYHSLTNLNMFNVGYILLKMLSIQYECFHITVNVSVTHIKGEGGGEEEGEQRERGRKRRKQRSRQMEREIRNCRGKNRKGEGKEKGRKRERKRWKEKR